MIKNYFTERDCYLPLTEREAFRIMGKALQDRIYMIYAQREQYGGSIQDVLSAV